MANRLRSSINELLGTNRATNAYAIDQSPEILGESLRILFLRNMKYTECGVRG